MGLGRESIRVENWWSRQTLIMTYDMNSRAKNLRLWSASRCSFASGIGPRNRFPTVK
jgi:hypothetical protein